MSCAVSPQLKDVAANVRATSAATAAPSALFSPFPRSATRCTRLPLSLGYPNSSSTLSCSTAALQNALLGSSAHLIRFLSNRCVVDDLRAATLSKLSTARTPACFSQRQQSFDCEANRGDVALLQAAADVFSTAEGEAKELSLTAVLFFGWVRKAALSHEGALERDSWKCVPAAVAPAPALLTVVCCPSSLRRAAGRPGGRAALPRVPPGGVRGRRGARRWHRIVLSPSHVVSRPAPAA